MVNLHEEAPLRRLWRYASGHRSTVWLASFHAIANKILDLAPPLLIGAAVDVVVRGDQSILTVFGVTEPADQIWLLAGLTVTIWALESITEYLSNITWRNLAQTLQHEMRMDAYTHVQKLEMAFFEDSSTGGLMSVLNDDVNQLERFLDNGASYMLQITTTVLAIGGYYFWVAPDLAWMAMLPMPFVLWGSVAWQKRLMPRYAEVREEVGLLNGDLAGNLGGVATIKSYTAEANEVERVRARSNSYRDSNRKAIRLSSAFSPLIRMIIVLGFTAILVGGGLQAIRGELDVGIYATMIFLTQRLLWPLTQLGQTFDLYQRAMASTRRILDLLELEPGIKDGTQSMPLAEVRGELTFDGVDFGYGDRTRLLSDLSLQMPAGKTTAIVGSTGSGKSTLVKLLLRFYDVDSGVIRLDGHDLRELSLYDLRRSIGLVSQDVFLFHGTVLENIVYGRPGATLEEVEHAARIAEAEEFIRELPQGYDTIVGERGQKLSGGQRQRISIARAVLKDPPILILDEATSAVDNETEAAIQRSLERLAVGRTTIVIAHRLSTVRHADMIHVLERGVLVEAGHHNDLVARNGLYAGLWRVQTGAVVAAS
jgi:ATP-binding cassette, subfamily B, bacterial